MASLLFNLPCYGEGEAARTSYGNTHGLVFSGHARQPSLNCERSIMEADQYQKLGKLLFRHGMGH